MDGEKDEDEEDEDEDVEAALLPFAAILATNGKLI